MEAIERLSQLMAWQDKQRATLLQQQQQQIVQLQQNKHRLQFAEGNVQLDSE